MFSNRCRTYIILLLLCSIPYLRCNHSHRTTTTVNYGFNDAPCIISCKSRLHTMCDFAQAQNCLKHDFFDYDMHKLKSLDLQNRLVQGHSGLRDRIARRMNVSNMIELAWDDELAQMVRSYSHYCTPFENDECTHFEEETLDHSEHVEQFYRNTNAYKFIAQNRYCMHGKYFPSNFVELIMRSWYFEKKLLVPPERYVHPNHNTELGVIKGENNFTHLAFPLSFKFGCGLSRFDNNYCIICNYYPHYRSKNNTMEFSSGIPASACPAQFPLKHSFFRHLCTNNHKARLSFSGTLLILALSIIFIDGINDIDI